MSARAHPGSTPRPLRGAQLRTDFLRRPRSPWEWVADVVRVLGAVSIVVAGIGWGPTGAAVVLLAASSTVLPRMLGLRGGLDLAICVVVLVAAWSGVLEVYQAIPWWDVAVHVVCTGLIAAVGVVVLGRAGVAAPARADDTPAFVPVVVASVIGLALSALWEIAEWVGHTVVDPAIYVAYDDTIGDLVAGLVGSVLAGILVALVRVERRR